MKNRLCLNMIVKNEAENLPRCLRSVAPWIDCYVIGDTGSTDETVEIIRRELDDLPGRIESFPFNDFGQARNEALLRCRKFEESFDYILLCDADMELFVEDSDFKKKLSEPAYSVRQVSNSLSYSNVRLIHKDHSAVYVGATHEYLSTGLSPQTLESIWFKDHESGANRGDKSERDRRLLEATFAKHPNDARTLFYLAQTYKDLGRYDDAVAMYERRIKVGGWDEEVWYSRYMIAKCLLEVGRIDAAIGRAVQAFQARPWRSEPLYLIAKHHRLRGESEASMMFVNAGRKIPKPTDDRLFIEHAPYDYGFDEELSISGYYVRSEETKQAARETCFRLSTSRELPERVAILASRNSIAYANKASEIFGESIKHTVIPPPEGETYRAMNPSVWIDKGQLRCNLRLVNYEIRAGRYHIDDPHHVIRTKNVLVDLSVDLDPIRYHQVETEKDAPFSAAKIRGFEDCRMFMWRGDLWASATVRDYHPDARAEIAILRLKSERILEVHIQKSNASLPHLHQKNWMPLVRGDELFFVYSAEPTRILKINPETMEAGLHQETTPPARLSSFRGSSQAVRCDDGWLCVTHEAFDGFGVGRRYLHRLVWMDEQFRIRRMSKPFRFIHDGIEFCAGLAVMDNILIFSFGVEDREAHLISFNRRAALKSLHEAP